MRSRFKPSPRVNPKIEGPTMTQQHMKNEADINTITSRYMKTGMLGNPNATRQAQFGDYTSIEFMDMKNAIVDMNSNFMSLPAKIRGKFANDPYQMLRWLENPANAEQAYKMGLISKEEAGIPETDPNQVPLPLDGQKPAEPDATATPAPSPS